MYAEKAGDELDFDFSGTGSSVEGNWYKDGGKADIYVDGSSHIAVSILIIILPISSIQ